MIVISFLTRSAPEILINHRMYCERFGYEHVVIQCNNHETEPRLTLKYRGVLRAFQRAPQNALIAILVDTAIVVGPHALSDLMHEHDALLMEAPNGELLSDVLILRNTPSIDAHIERIAKECDIANEQKNESDLLNFITPFNTSNINGILPVVSYDANWPVLWKSQPIFALSLCDDDITSPELITALTEHANSFFQSDVLSLINRHTLLEAAQFKPHWLQPSAWNGHLPFAAWIIKTLRPRRFVELGTYLGGSYFSFCQSVDAERLATQCFAVDTWQGDEHAGQYGEGIYQHVHAHNEQYARFSHLLRMTFDEALAHFTEGSVDLLHIDGLHTYEAVRHDFETWLPKLSANAVVLFHDTCVHDRGFGVWQFWAELKTRYPYHFEFKQSFGLGVLCIGQPSVEHLDWFTPYTAQQNQLLSYFTALGEHQLECAELAFLRTQMEAKSATPAQPPTVQLMHAIWARQFELLTPLKARDGLYTVQNGPFKGMKLCPSIVKADYVPKILGAYEQELHETIEYILTKPYTHIVDIGCAEGFYAVGFALRMPKATIFAHDLNETAQNQCRDAAHANGVSNIHINGLFSESNFANLPAGASLVFCDIEGGEMDLLNPEQFPALRKLDVLVELHDCFNSEISSVLKARFAKTHRIHYMPNVPTPHIDLSSWIPANFPLSPLDGWIAGSDTRMGATPWAYFESLAFLPKKP